MERDLNVLVINPKDKHGQLATVVKETYGDNFHFTSVEFTPSLHLAVKSLEEAQFHLCFISSHFSEDELKSFFTDIEKIGVGKWCSFLQIFPILTDDHDTEELKKQGFQGIVSEMGTHADREEVTLALQTWREDPERYQTRADVVTAMNVLLRKIDDAASNLKRGVTTKIDSIPTEFIEIKTSTDDAILDTFFNKLGYKTELAEPENEHFVEIPDKILGKHLPNLEKNKYTGVSTRVWKKLLKTHGVQETQATAAVATEEAPGAEESDSSLPSEE